MKNSALVGAVLGLAPALLSGVPLLPGAMVHVHGGLVDDHAAEVVAEVVAEVDEQEDEVCVCSAAAARSWPCSKSTGRCLPKRKNIARR